MSYNGSGTFQINTSGQPVVTGTSISSTVFNALTADLATGLSTAITKDGQTTTTARIPFALGINSTLVTDATNTTSGSIITAGGVGIAKAVFIGTTLNVAGASTMTGSIAVDSVTDSSSTTTGSIQTDGGVGIAKALYVGTTANVAGAVTLGGVATFSAQPIFSSLTASSAVATDASKGLISVTNTGTGNNVLATGPTISGPTISDGTANGVAYLNGSKVLTTGSALVFDGTNLGLGNAPYVWLSSFRSLDIGSTASFAYFNSGSYVYNNAYYNTSSNLVYKTTGYAQSYIQSSTGQHVWQIAPSGTAGNAISFTQAMSLDASGRFSNLNTGANVQTSFTASHASSPYGIDVYYSATAPNGTSNQFLYCEDTGGQRMSVRSNGGIANYSANNVNLSDRREKTNFAPAKSYLDVICAIPVQTFNYIDQNLEEDDGLTLGVVAQDVQAVAPELVTESNWGTEEKPKMRLSIYQTDLQYALMKCIQEQQAIITTLTDRITALEARNG